MPSTWTRRRRLLLFLAAFGLLATGGLFRPAIGQTSSSITLVWTAPGDDGAVGRATRYDLRYSQNAISGTDTTTWWNSAIVVNMSTKVPSSAGALDSMAIAGVTMGVRYYAILRAADEVPNWSRFSNVASFILTDLTPPRQIVDLIGR